MKVIDPGHIYDLRQLGSEDPIRLIFAKRSSGVAEYDEEWIGLQTQELFRVAIDRTLFLNEILPCAETEDAVYYARMALFSYEARAWRRKQQKLNRKKPAHDDSARPRAWRENPFDDVPFNEYEIEKRPIGPDGHIII